MEAPAFCGMPPIRGKSGRTQTRPEIPVVFLGDIHQPHEKPGKNPPLKKKDYLLMCTTFAGGNPLKYVDEAWEYAPIFIE